MDEGEGNSTNTDENADNQIPVPGTPAPEREISSGG